MFNSFQEILAWLHLHGGNELGYVTLIVALFIVPRLFLRFGVPMALTAFCLGIGVKYLFNFVEQDDVIPIFSTLGIISLFLFAGLEVDLSVLRLHARAILGHIGARIIAIALLAAVFIELHNVSIVIGIMLALAVATPSTGFILGNL